MRASCIHFQGLLRLEQLRKSFFEKCTSKYSALHLSTNSRNVIQDAAHILLQKDLTWKGFPRREKKLSSGKKTLPLVQIHGSQHTKKVNFCKKTSILLNRTCSQVCGIPPASAAINRCNIMKLQQILKGFFKKISEKGWNFLVEQKIRKNFSKKIGEKSKNFRPKIFQLKSNFFRFSKNFPKNRKKLDFNWKIFGRKFLDFFAEKNRKKSIFLFDQKFSTFFHWFF